MRKIFFVLSLIATPIFAQQQQNIPPKFIIELTPQQLETVEQGLAELPLKTSGNTFGVVQQQVQKQVEAYNKPSEKNKGN